MARDVRFPTTPVAEDFEVGDDSDSPGFDQPFSGDDIDALVSSGRGTVIERREMLQRARADLEQRRVMDESGDAAALVARIDDALATLAAPADGIGTPGAYAHDARDRAMQPDEILEREEDEANLD
jgi:hypothetical protein